MVLVNIIGQMVQSILVHSLRENARVKENGFRVQLMEIFILERIKKIKRREMASIERPEDGYSKERLNQI